MKVKNYTIWSLIKDSLNPNSGIASAKRLNLLLSQALFSLQITIDIIVHTYILIFKEPLPSVEFYKTMAAVQGLGLGLNALIVLWNLGAIKSVDVAFAKVIQQQVVKPNTDVVADAETIVKTDIDAETVNTNLEPKN